MSSTALGKAGKDPLVKTDSLRSSSFCGGQGEDRDRITPREQLLVQNFPQMEEKPCLIIFPGLLSSQVLALLRRCLVPQVTCPE